MLAADLDRELAAAVAALAADGELPALAAALPPSATGGTWRPAPDGRPASYSTSLPFRLARVAGRSPAAIAATLARRLAAVPWVEATSAAGGYLTITVTQQALAASAAAAATAGRACARSTILAGTVATVGPWPDLAAAPGWTQAWRAHRAAMGGRLAQAAGASVSVSSYRERGTSPSPPIVTAPSPVRTAADYHGPCSVRFRLARTLPGQVAQLADTMRPDWPHAGLADPLYLVQQAHAAAASTLRWAGDLGLAPRDPRNQPEPVGQPDPWDQPDRRDQPDRGDQREQGEELAGQGLGSLLGSAEELALLGLLSYLPVRVAAAARRNRPAELPRYLEQVAGCWEQCRLARPALPFGGYAAAHNPPTTRARLILAAAVKATLAVGLALIGVTAADRL